jgi:hypothetical protein
MRSSKPASSVDMLMNDTAITPLYHRENTLASSSKRATEVALVDTTISEIESFLELERVLRCGNSVYAGRFALLSFKSKRTHRNANKHYKSQTISSNTTHVHSYFRVATSNFLFRFSTDSAVRNSLRARIPIPPSFDDETMR